MRSGGGFVASYFYAVLARTDVMAKTRGQARPQRKQSSGHQQQDHTDRDATMQLKGANKQKTKVQAAWNGKDWFKPCCCSK